jgi:hypothetical protein
MAGKSGSDRSKVSRETSQQQNREAPTPSSAWGEVHLYRGDSDRLIDREFLLGPEDGKPALNRLRSRNPLVIDSIVEFVPNLANLIQFLNAEWRRDLVVSDLQAYLIEELNSRLSPSDCALFGEHGLAIPDKTSRQRICNAIDEIILQAAIEQGPNFFLIPTVLQRVTDWVFADENNGERWEELGARFAQLARVVRGRAYAPLYPWWVRSRKAILGEVRVLRRQLRADVPKYSGLSKRRLIRAALDTIEEHHSKFPKILRIGVPFQSFIESETGVFRRLLQRELAPSEFTGQLIKWITNYEPESSRQLINRLLSNPRFRAGSPSSDL